jgi:hypothetical protein
MREKIERYARGEFDEQIPQIVLPKENLVWEIDAESKFQGSVKFHSENGIRIRGYAITTDANMKLENDQFYGKGIKLGFQYHSKNIAPGDRKRGKIILITNAGEFLLSFEIRIRKDEAKGGDILHV